MLSGALRPAAVVETLVFPINLITFRERCPPGWTEPLYSKSFLLLKASPASELLLGFQCSPVSPSPYFYCHHFPTGADPEGALEKRLLAFVSPSQSLLSREFNL